MIGWNSIKLRLLGRDIEGVTQIEYTDEQEIKNEYGAGAYPVGQSTGNYSATAKISMYKEELIGLQESLPKGKRIQEIDPFDVPVVYEYQGKLYKDVIRNCRFKNNGVSVSNNDGKVVQDIELICTHIDWNV